MRLFVSAHLSANWAIAHDNAAILRGADNRKDTPSLRSDRLWYLLVVLSILAAAGLRILMISVPLDRDEGMYAYIGQRILVGDVPYKDALETKPPGVFWTFAAIFSIHQSVVFLRGVLILWSILTCLLFFRLAKKLYGLRTGAIAASVLVLSLTAPAYCGYSANAEMFMITLVIAALLLLPPREKPCVPVDALAGALLGAALMFKPVALTEGLPAALLILLAASTWKAKIWRLSWVAAGFGAIAVAVWAVLWFQGAGNEFLFWAFGYNVQYASALPGRQRLAVFFYQILTRDMLLRDWPVYGLALVGAGVTLGRRKDLLRSLFPIGWAVSALIGTSASGRFTAHYFIQFLPPAALLCGLGADRLLKAFANLQARPGLQKGLAAGLLALILIYPTGIQSGLYAAGPNLSRMLYGLNPFMEGEQIGRWLAERTSPQDTVFVCGTEAQFLFFAKRKSATRFIAAYPLGGTHPKAETWQKEALDDVRRLRPKYIVAVNLASSMILDKKAPRHLFDELGKILGADYTMEASLVADSKTETRLVPADRLTPADKLRVLDLYRVSQSSP